MHSAHRFGFSVVAVLQAACFAALAGCGSAARTSPGASGLQNVFGTDDRTAVAQPTFPVTAVARLDRGCSGVFVGKNLFLTGASCLFQEDGTIASSAFSLHADFAADGAPALAAKALRAWYGTKTADDERGKDWAILQLETPAGFDRWLPVDGTTLVDATLPYQVSQFGYDIGQGAGNVVTLVRSCAIRDRGEDHRMLNDCDAERGIKGAPLVRDLDQGPAIVAIAVSEYRQGASSSLTLPAYSPELANVALDASVFAPTLAALKETVEQGLPAPDLPGVLEAEAPAGP